MASHHHHNVVSISGPRDYPLRPIDRVQTARIMGESEEVVDLYRCLESDPDSDLRDTVFSFIDEYLVVGGFCFLAGSMFTLVMAFVWAGLGL